MYSMDNVDDPPNTYDVSYGETISGVEDHQEETHYEDNTDGNQQFHPPDTQKQCPPDTQDAPTAEQNMPTDNQMVNNQESIQQDMVDNSQEFDIKNSNNDTKEDTEVQEAPIASIERTTNKISQKQDR